MADIWHTRRQVATEAYLREYIHKLRLQTVEMKEQHFSTASSPVAMRTDAAYT